jgi:tyrosyl-tRNA synthetase
MSFAHPNEQIGILLRGVVDVVEREELLARLTRSADRNEPLTVMAGFDPSAPDLHLGHTVLLRKMRQFQELGHKVIFLIGDFTATVGDPSGHDGLHRQRPSLTSDQVEQFSRTYLQQVSRILDPGNTRVEHNSSWLKDLPLSNLLSLASHIPVKRLASWHEPQTYDHLCVDRFLYPLLQAYDSIHLKVDIQIGGQDQVQNLLVVRELMAAAGQEPQCVLVTQLLEGTDATLCEGKFVGRKMSKTFDNTIGITESPEKIQSKVLALNDALIWRYFELLTDCSMPEISAFKMDVEAGKRSMQSVKEYLAQDLIRMYHS